MPQTPDPRVTVGGGAHSVVLDLLARGQERRVNEVISPCVYE